MDPEHLLEFRDDMEKVPPEIEPEPPEPVHEAEDDIEQTLSAAVTPFTTPEQASELLAHLSENEQRRGLLWLSQNMGALYATRVADYLGGDDGAVGEQMRSLANTINAGTMVGGLGATLSREPTQGSQQEKDQQQDAEGKETLFSFSDPLLGDFVLLFDVEQGVKTAASTDKVTISSAAGLTLRTPSELPDITITKIELDLNSGQVSIDANPEIGEFEEEILSALIRETLLRDIDTENLVNPVTAGLDGLKKNDDGHIYLLESGDADALLDPTTEMTSELTNSSLKVSFSKAIYVDVWGPFNMNIHGVEYFFSTQSLALDTSPKGNWITSGIRNAIRNVAQGKLRDMIVDKLPEAMKKAGYDPSKDDNIGQHFQELLSNFAGGGNKDTANNDTETVTEDDQVIDNEQQEEDPFADVDAQIVYRLNDPRVGHIAVAMDRGDQLTIDKSAEQISVGSSNGVYLLMPGAEWTQTLRLNNITYDVASGEMNIAASKPIGEAIKSVLEGLMKRVVLPYLPGEVHDALGTGEEELEVDENGEQTLYELPVEGLGTAIIAAAADDHVQITKDESSLVMQAPKGIRVRVAGAGWIPEARIGRMHYDIATGKVTLEPPAGEQAAADLGPITEQILSTLVSTQLLARLPGAVRDGAGLQGESSVEVDEAEANLLFAKSIGSLGTIDASIAHGDNLDFAYNDRGVEIRAQRGILVRLAELGIAARLFDLTYNPQTDEVTSRAEPPLGDYEHALLAGAVKEFILPQIGDYIASQDDNLQDDQVVLWKQQSDDGTSFNVAIDKGDSLTVHQDATTLRVTSANGIYWFGNNTTAEFVPTNRIYSVSMDLETGQLTIEAETSVGELGNKLATELVQRYALPEISDEMRDKVFNGQDPLRAENQEVEAPDENSLYSVDLGNMGQIDFSLSPGDRIGFRATDTGVALSVAHGLLVRWPHMNVTARFYDLEWDHEKQTLTTNRSEPELGDYERELLEAQLAKWVEPHIHQYMRSQDKDLGDDTTVLYNWQLGSYGNVRFCIDKGDSISIDQDADRMTVTAGNGLYWLSDGQAQDILAPNRVRSVSLDLNTGQVDIDADRDVGELGNMVATRLVHSMMLPSLSEENRQRMFGGKDPMMDSEDLSIPPEGDKVIYRGTGDIEFDLSLSGEGLFSIDARPDGMVRFDTKGRGLLFRIPSAGVAFYIWDLVIDPKTGAIQSMNSHPQAGAAELDLFRRAARHFIGPVVSEYIPQQSGGDQSGSRTIASYGAFELTVPEAATLSLDHQADRTVLSAGRTGFFINSSMSQIPPINFSSITYEHETGKIDIDLVDTVDTSKFRDPREVAGITEAALSEMLRQALDPHLTDELRELGLAGREASTADNRLPNYGTAPWLNTEVDGLGRVQVFTSMNEDLGIDITTSGIHIFSDTAVMIKLPDLGLWTQVMDIYYDYETEDVRVDSLGRLENTIIQQIVHGIVAEYVPDRNPNDNVGPIADNINANRNRRGKIIIPLGDKGNLEIPRDGIGSVRLSGNRLFVGFDKPIMLDGEGPGNYKFHKVEYEFGTGQISWTIESTNPIAWLFTGKAHDAIGDGLVGLIEEYLPTRMRYRGYNLMTDPNRESNIAQLIANFRDSGASASGGGS